jgi:ATP-dependent RNA helicase RhlE
MPSPCTATSRSQREKALARFESGRVDTLVATDVAARGIDVRDISHVINFDPPEDREGYVHRTGRTGRAGETGRAITFVNADQAGDVGKIAAALELHEEWGSAGFTLKPSARPHASGGGGSRRRNQRYRSRNSRW